ncbi:secondary glycine betaine transporter BetU [Klebsiella pneumoniae]|nr:secondary glycine betaine transporter BetU [Klebsiella pneumoniae]
MSLSRANGWGLDITVLGMVAFMVAVCGDVHRTGSPAGRTIREFVTGVLFVPAGFTLMWMTVFGNSAIYLIMNQGATDLANTVQQDVALALFNFLEHFPFSSVLSFIAMAMVIVFFVTSADSGAMVVDTLATGGVANTPVCSEYFGPRSWHCPQLRFSLPEG